MRAPDLSNQHVQAPPRPHLDCRRTTNDEGSTAARAAAAPGHAGNEPSTRGAIPGVLDGLRDAQLDAAIREFDPRYPGDRYILTPCAAADEHATEFEGMRLYLRRLDAGISRAQLEDRLLDAGVRCSVDDVAAWERGERVPPGEALLALPRLVRAHLGDLVLCWTCLHAIRPSSSSTGAVEIRFDGAAIVRAREAFKISRDDAAALADVEPRVAELIERGKWGVVNVDEILRYADALDVEDDALEACFVRERHGAAFVCGGAA